MKENNGFQINKASRDVKYKFVAFEKKKYSFNKI
jgi:hypothetical protein